MLIKRMGFVGFREYLRTYKGKWTPDTGPIIAGMGVAASALAMKAAMAVGDEETFRALQQASTPLLRILEILSPVPLLGAILVGTTFWRAAFYCPLQPLVRVDVDSQYSPQQQET